MGWGWLVCAKRGCMWVAQAEGAAMTWEDFLWQWQKLQRTDKNLQDLLRPRFRIGVLSFSSHLMDQSKSYGQTHSQRSKEVHSAHREAKARAWVLGKVKN